MFSFQKGSLCSFEVVILNVLFKTQFFDYNNIFFFGIKLIQICCIDVPLHGQWYLFHC